MAYFPSFQDINVCILENYPECSNPRVFYIIPYFCGQHPQCRYLTHDTAVVLCEAVEAAVFVPRGFPRSYALISSSPGSQECGLWRGPSRTCWRTTSSWVSWRSWRTSCSSLRGSYLITLLECSISIRALVRMLGPVWEKRKVKGRCGVIQWFYKIDTHTLEQSNPLLWRRPN